MSSAPGRDDDARGASRARKRVLMIAYHFPPLAGSSGVQRTLRFVQQLPQFGWQPIVLTASPRAYERTSDDLLADVPAGVVVRHAFALDTARHLALGGRYFAPLARPDRWVSWRLDGVRQGLDLVRRLRPQALWSTYPIATAHLIGANLHERTGLPWIADFRDPMAQDGYPADPLTWRQYDAIERCAVTQAAASLFTTPSAARTYRQRYPQAAARIGLLENGYDEDSFAKAERAVGAREPLVPGALTLLHSGIVYPDERDPTQLIAAIGHLRAAGALPPGRLKLRFRAAVHDALLRQLAARHGVDDVVETLPPLDYAAALAEMLRADGLLLMQAANCNEQIPAKLYEYLRAGAPILCLSHPAGDTEAVVRAAGVDSCAALDDASGIHALVERFLADPRAMPRPRNVAAHSRLARSAALARELDRIVASNATERAAVEAVSTR